AHTPGALPNAAAGAARAPPSVAGLLDAADAAGASAALDEDLALLLDPEPEVVFGLAAGHERPGERRLPAVEVASDREPLGPDLAPGQVVGGRVLDAPARAELIACHRVGVLGRRPIGAGATRRGAGVAARIRVGEPDIPVVVLGLDLVGAAIDRQRRRPGLARLVAGKV